MFPQDPPTPIILSARVFAFGQYIEAEIIEANASTQTALVRQVGTLPTFTAHYAQIICVSLKHANGAVIETFGAPKLNRVNAWESQYVNVL